MRERGGWESGEITRLTRLNHQINPADKTRTISGPAAFLNDGVFSRADLRILPFSLHPQFSHSRRK